jgi:hypothetical protein
MFETNCLYLVLKTRLFLLYVSAINSSVVTQKKKSFHEKYTVLCYLLPITFINEMHVYPI